MEKLLFKYISEDIIEFIKEYQKDFVGFYMDELKEFAEKKDYAGMFEEILGCIENGVYHDNDEIYNLYGSLNLSGYVFSYNKKFYKYLQSALKKSKDKGCIEYASYIKILLDSNYEQQSIEDILTVLSNSDKNVAIIYEDKSNKKTERIISDITIGLNNYLHHSIITAKCHLRNDERNFKLGSIISAHLITE